MSYDPGYQRPPGQGYQPFSGGSGPTWNDAMMLGEQMRQKSGPIQSIARDAGGAPRCPHCKASDFNIGNRVVGVLFFGLSARLLRPLVDRLFPKPKPRSQVWCNKCHGTAVWDAKRGY
jgi:hypothetical protein